MVLSLLIFVAEVALVVAVVIPVTLLALALGLKTHTVLLRAHGVGRPVVDRREVRGPVASVLAARELRSAANAGAYRR